MKRRMRLLAVIVVALLSVPRLAAASEDKHLYLVVLDPSGPALDVRGQGGEVEFEASDRIAIRLPEAALEGIIRNPRVRYIQRLVQGDETAARAISALRADSTPIAHASSSWTTGPHAYDGSGNLTSAGPNSDGVTNRFTYDGYGRLATSKVHVGAVAHAESYEYDRFGNLQARTTDGTRVDLPVDPVTNRMQGGARFDAVGNQVYDPLWGDLTYDAAGMVTSRGYGTLYAYDANDERVVQIQNYGGGNTRWRWSPRDLTNQVTREWESFGRFGWEYPVWVNDYVSAGGQLLAAEREEAEGGERHFHLDHLGTPRFATNGDGEIVSTHVLRPFGAEIANATQGQALTRLFTGHERDYGAAGGTYLDYMHARYYNAQWGRFLSVDPTWRSAHVAKPQSWNRYSYVANNPILSVDPTGKVGQVAIPLEIAAIGTGLYLCASSPVCSQQAVNLVMSGVQLVQMLAEAQPPATVDDAAEEKPQPREGSKGGPGAGKDFADKTKGQTRERDNNTCVFCGDKTTSEKGPKQSNIDHATPKARSGNNDPSNAQNTCRTCNLQKGAKTTLEYLEWLAKKAAEVAKEILPR